MNKDSPILPAVRHDFTFNDMDFIAAWLIAMDRIDPDIRGKVNSITIPLTGTFIGMDNTGLVSVDKKER